jgi:5-amino-6-(5-phosphoribosylamino)uracil reductase
MKAPGAKRRVPEKKSARPRASFPSPATRHASLPHVLVNMAMTADGKIATANRAITSFGSARDHEHLLELRATVDAVMSGARTVDGGKINLGPGGKKFQQRRLKQGLAEFNLRIIVSGNGSIDPRAEIFKHTFSPILILTTRRASAQQLATLRKLATAVKICGTSEVNFRVALRWLREKWGVQRLLCEGGGELNRALFRAGLVDELHLTVCPRIFGGRSAPTIADGPTVPSLTKAAKLQLHSQRRVGDELFLVYVRAANARAKTGSC